MFSPAPRALRNPVTVTERLRMLDSVESIQPLRHWAADYSARRTAAGRATVMPHFDPADAGVNARVLMLLEAPGPMTNAGNKRPGSGFISSDNNDMTAENGWTLRRDSGLDETTTAVWNIVPFYLGPASVKPKAADLKEGAAALLEVMSLMPELRVVIASGLYARKGWSRYVVGVRPDITAVTTWHPSPLAMNQPGKREHLLDGMRTAANLAR